MAKLGQRGQATAEYILLLGIVVGFALLVANNLIRPVYKKLSDRISKQIDQTIFHGDLHHIRISR